MGSASSSMSANPLARQSQSGTGSNMGSGPPPPPPGHAHAYTTHARSANFDPHTGYAPAPSADGSRSNASSSSQRLNGGSSSRYASIPAGQRLTSSGMDRNHSISTTLGLPLSRVAIRSDEDMEEGEILDEAEGDDHGALSSTGSKRRRPISPRKYGQEPYEHYSPPGTNRNLPGPSALSGSRYDVGRAQGGLNRVDVTNGTPAFTPTANGAASAPQPTIDTLNETQALIPLDDSSRPSDLSEAEARKYMDLIHTLLKSGESPDVLVERGANREYVTAVCEEIIQGTHRRKEVSLEAKPTTSITSSPRPIHRNHVTSAQAGSAENPFIGSPSSDDVEVVVSTDRRMSMSSEGSAEFQLIEKPSPPRARMTRIMPSSSWAPTAATVPLASASVPAPPAQPIRVDRYTPSQAAQSSGRSTPIVDSFVPAQHPQPTTVHQAPPLTAEALPPPPSLPERSHLADVAAAGPSRQSHDVPTGPRNLGAKRPKRNKKKRFEDEADAEVQVLNYDDEVEPAPKELNRPEAVSVPVAIDPSPQVPTTTPAPVFNPTAAFNQTPVPHFLPTPATMSLLRPGAMYPAQSAPAVISAPSAAQLEIKAKNDMLEIRRRALASMKLRKAKKTSPEKASVDLPSLDPTALVRAKTIEQEVLDLEQEVIGLQAIADATPDEGSSMELDTSDSGQGTPSISPSVLPATISSTTSLAIPPILPTSSSLPTRRGVKRPNAEDMMESRPSSSAPSWIRRKPFGGLPQRPGRLLINLDDHSDSESDDEVAGFSTPPIVIKNVMVEDKEEQIRALRAKIAAIQARKKVTAAAGSSALDTGATGSPASDSPGLSPAVVQAVAADTAAAALSVKATEEDVAVMTAEAADAAVDTAERAIAAAEISIATANLPAAMTSATPSGTSETDMDIDEMDDDTEMRPIEVLSSPRPSDDDGDIVALPSPSASAQAPTYKAYTPLLGRYPQLSATSHSTQSFSQYSAAPARPLKLRDIFIKLDRELLSSIMLTHRLARNPSAMLCPAEVGGGICADAKCPFLHLDKDEPTGEDWTEYTYQVMSRTRETAIDRKMVQKAVATTLGKQFAKGKGKAQPAQGYGKASSKRDAVQKALEIILAGIGIGIGEAEKAATAAGKVPGA